MSSKRIWDFIDCLPKAKYSTNICALAEVVDEFFNGNVDVFLSQLSNDIFYYLAGDEQKLEYFKDINYYKVWQNSFDNLVDILELYFSKKRTLTMLDVRIALKPLKVLVNWYTGYEVYNSPVPEDLIGNAEVPPDEIQANFYMYVDFQVDEGEGGGGPAFPLVFPWIFFGVVNRTTDAFKWFRQLLPKNVKLIEFETPEEVIVEHLVKGKVVCQFFEPNDYNGNNGVGLQFGQIVSPVIEPTTQLTIPGNSTYVFTKDGFDYETINTEDINTTKCEYIFDVDNRTEYVENGTGQYLVYPVPEGWTKNTILGFSNYDNGNISVVVNGTRYQPPYDDNFSGILISNMEMTIPRETGIGTEIIPETEWDKEFPIFTFIFMSDVNLDGGDTASNILYQPIEFKSGTTLNLFFWGLVVPVRAIDTNTPSLTGEDIFTQGSAELLDTFNIQIIGTQGVGYSEAQDGGFDVYNPRPTSQGIIIEGNTEIEKLVKGSITFQLYTDRFTGSGSDLYYGIKVGQNTDIEPPNGNLNIGDYIIYNDGQDDHKYYISENKLSQNITYEIGVDSSGLGEYTTLSTGTLGEYLIYPIPRGWTKDIILYYISAESGNIEYDGSSSVYNDRFTGVRISDVNIDTPNNLGIGTGVIPTEELDNEFPLFTLRLWTDDTLDNLAGDDIIPPIETEAELITSSVINLRFDGLVFNIIGEFSTTPPLSIDDTFVDGSTNMDNYLEIDRTLTGGENEVDIQNIKIYKLKSDWKGINKDN